MTEYAKDIAKDLQKKVGSFKIMISAGVIALSKLSADEREKLNVLAQSPSAQKDVRKEPTEAIEKLRQTVAYFEGERVKILGPKEQEYVRQLCKLLEAEPPDVKRKKKKA